MHLIDALSLEAPMAEEQFLLRDLGVRWNTVTEDELIGSLRSGSPSLVITSNPHPYSRALNAARPRSVALLQISDEAYSTDRISQARCLSVRTVFRHYAPVIAPLLHRVRAVAGFVSDAHGSDIASRSAKPLYESGTAVRRRMMLWQSVEAPVHAIPLGYTNAFATTIDEEGGGPSVRSTSICFRGNRGLAPRILGLEEARRLPGANIALVDQGWSGTGSDHTGARRYVEQLRGSRFALVPPGFVNAESFRYYEALSCGALPVEICIALTHQGEVPFRSNATVRAWSWKEAMKKVASMPEDERISRLTAARTLMARQFDGARRLIHESMEE